MPSSITDRACRRSNLIRTKRQSEKSSCPCHRGRCAQRGRAFRGPAKSGVLAAHRYRRYSLRVRLRALVVLAVCFLLLAGCARTRQPKITVLPANQVMIARVIPAGVAPRDSGCAVKTLNQMPGAGFRELGTIRLAGAVPSAADVTTLLDQQACALGADAVFIKQIQEQSAGDKVEYEITAAAIGFGPKRKAGPSKTITPRDSVAKSGERPMGQWQSEDIVVPETAAATSPSLEAPVIPMQSGEEEPQEGESPKQSANEEPSGEPSSAETPSGEVLMQPVEPEAGARTGGQAPPARGEESTTMSESAIPPTEAAPLQPAAQPSLAVTPTPTATPPPPMLSEPSPTPSPSQAATASAARTPSAIPSPPSTPLPSATLSPTPTATPTPAPTPSPTPAAPVLAPAPSPTPAAPSTTATPTGSPSATPTPSLTRSGKLLKGEIFHSPSPSPTPSPTPTQPTSTPIATPSPSLTPSPTPTEAPIAIATPARSPTPIETPQSMPSPLRATPAASEPPSRSTPQSAGEPSSGVQALPLVTTPSPPLTLSPPLTPSLSPTPTSTAPS